MPDHATPLTPTEQERAREADRARMPAWFIACTGLGMFALSASAPLAHLVGVRWDPESFVLIPTLLILVARLALFGMRRTEFGPANHVYRSSPALRLGSIALAVLGWLATTALTQRGMAVPAIVVALALSALVTAGVAHLNRSACRKIRAGRYDHRTWTRMAPR